MRRKISQERLALYKKMYEHYKTRLDKLMAAQDALIEGGVKSYTIDDRSLTRFDIDKLASEIEDTAKKCEEYEALLNGRSPRKAVGVVPRDV